MKNEVQLHMKSVLRCYMHVPVNDESHLCLFALIHRLMDVDVNMLSQYELNSMEEIALILLIIINLKWSQGTEFKINI